MDYTTHVTTDGERWDSIANIAYGKPFMSDGIKQANPTIPNTETLPGGLTIYIPVLSKEDGTAIQTELLPPWA